MAGALVSLGAIGVVVGIGLVLSVPITRWRYGDTDTTSWAVRFARPARWFVAVGAALVALGIAVGVMTS